MMSYRITAINGDITEQVTRTFNDINDARYFIRPYLGSAKYVIIERFVDALGEYRPVGLCFWEEIPEMRLHGKQRYKIDGRFIAGYFYASYWRAEDSFDARVTSDQPLYLYEMNILGELNMIHKTKNTFRYEKAKNYAESIMRGWY